MRTRTKWWLLAVAAVLFVRAALPLLIEWQIERQGALALGRTVEVDDVNLGLLAGRVELVGVRVGAGVPADGQALAVDANDAMISLGRGAVDLELTALLRGEIRLRSLELDEPGVHVARDPQGQMTQLVLAQTGPQDELRPTSETAEGDAWPVVVESLRITDTGVELLDQTQDPARLVKFSLGELALQNLQLLAGDVSLGGVSLAEPKLRVHRDVVLGWQTVAADQPAPEPAMSESSPGVSQAPAPAQAGAFRMNSLNIDSAEFVLLTEDQPLAVEISLSASNATLEPGVAFPARIELGVGGGRIEVDGQVTAAPPAFRGTLVWSGIDFPLLTTALDLEMPTKLESVLASGDLQVDLRPGEGDTGGRLQLSGRMRSENVVALHEPSGTRFELDAVQLDTSEMSIPLGDRTKDQARIVAVLDLDGLRLLNPAEGFEFTLGGLHAEAEELKIDVAGGAGLTLARLEAIEIREPHVRYTLPTASGSEPASTDPEPDSPATQPRVLVAHMKLVGGEVEFNDPSVGPPYRAKLKDIRIDAQGLRWPEQEAERFNVRVSGPGPGRLRVAGGLLRDRADLTLKLNSLLLPAFNPYANPLGYSISKGALALESKIGRRGEDVEVTSQLTLDQLDVNSSEDGLAAQIGVPVDLGIALLQDSSGRIQLPIHLAARRGELRAQLMPTVLAALRGAAVSAVQSPLRALASFGKEKNELTLQVLRAAPGSSQPSEEAMEQAALLADFLGERPRLALAFHGQVGPADEAPLATQTLAEQVRNGGDLPELQDVGLFARRRVRSALQEHGAAAGEHLDAEGTAILQRYVAAVQVSDERRHALASARAESLRRLLVERGVSPTRVRVRTGAEGEPGVLPEFVANQAPAADATDPARPGVGSR